MDTRKICLLGDFAVGKTSLVARFIHNQFSEKYLTSIGVKVDTREMARGDGSTVKLAIWDVAGTDTPTELFLRYLRGSAGYFLVADGTRRDTLERALALRHAVESQLAPLPFIGLINKCDLGGEQEIGDARIAELAANGGLWLRTSARTGENVERAFDILLSRLDGER
jgi:small GTP-binding protein